MTTKRHSYARVAGGMTGVAAIICLAALASAAQAATQLGAARAAQGRAGSVLLMRGAGYEQPQESDRVRALQRRLRQLNQSPGPIDGLFGPLTEAAVRGFQRQHGVSADGIVGPRTSALLAGALKLAASRNVAPQRPLAGGSGAAAAGQAAAATFPALPVLAALAAIVAFASLAALLRVTPLAAVVLAARPRGQRLHTTTTRLRSALLARPLDRPG